jgi:hypothetical protein
LVYITRKYFNNYVDSYSNIRASVIFGVLWIPALGKALYSAVAYQYKLYGCIYLFYVSYITSCYLLDSFGLPLLKIYYRRNGCAVFDDVEFVAQDKMFDLKQIIADKKLCTLLLDYLKGYHCEENLYFIIKYLSLSSNSSMVSMEDASALYKNFIVKDAPQELNLSSQTFKNCESSFYKLNRAELLITAQEFLRVFQPVYHEVLALLYHNYFKDFLTSPEVAHFLGGS